ncbi:hypothetical protein RJ641_015461 [Dillenia turbinata]|uniref:C2H2-type domain-containing protein n=1 Tax=Dillenia turbinata TaxID=194707 RepID=A0AAN8V221_9MAGN
MAGRSGLEFGFPKVSATSLKEQAAKVTLRNVRAKGHTYVDLREDGKRFVFFCTLCLAPCYSDAVLFDHLKGNLHSERLAAAKITLMGANPWPFNDGMVFFYVPPAEYEPLPTTNTSSRFRLLNAPDNEGDLSMGTGDRFLQFSGNGHVGHEVPGHNKELVSVDYYKEFGVRSTGVNMNADCGVDHLLIPGVLVEEVSDLVGKFMGFGQIGAKFCLDRGSSDEIMKIWCEWLGIKNHNDQDIITVPEHDFAVVNFSYSCVLARKGLFDDIKCLLSSSACSENEDMEAPIKKSRKSFSDPVDISAYFSNQYDSGGEDSSTASGSISRSLVDGYDFMLMDTRLISSKKIRCEVRKQQRVASERMCIVCQHKILPGKDAAALLNLKTGRLACMSRNVHGAFHLYHMSCLIHWMLLSEFEMYKNQFPSNEVQNSKSGDNDKSNGKKKQGTVMEIRSKITHLFCPECQGTGIVLEEGEELEKPTIDLSEIFKYKIKACDARNAWMKNPEILDHCSIGLNFPRQSKETVQEKVSKLKWIRFYRADYLRYYSNISANMWCGARGCLTALNLGKCSLKLSNQSGIWTNAKTDTMARPLPPAAADSVTPTSNSFWDMKFVRQFAAMLPKASPVPPSGPSPNIN